MSYEPTLESLQSHQVPAWYHDAKLGIFVHWGTYSVPGWAPLSGHIGALVAKEGWEAVFGKNPYAEWYANTLKFDGSPTQHYHEATYGADFPYAAFAPLFNEAVQAWDPEAWAGLFAQAGARYVVLTSKHHEGFCLWPTSTPCPRKVGYFSSRDLVGELADAVRGRGLRMGIYYSGGLDWAFNEARIQGMSDLFTTVVQEPEYVAYADGHWRELIDRYRPSLLWNDIGYPAAANLLDLFAYYYSLVPDGVINDRFPQAPQLEEGVELSLAELQDRIVTPHRDFVTPEYRSFGEIREEKWECCRAVGFSFAYNRNEGEGQYASVQSLVHMLADVVSKNGNLLLGVGPTADGTIPPTQQQRLLGLGQWLATNGEAIFGTRPWVRPEGETRQGLGLRFTRGDGNLYATLLGMPSGSQVSIRGLQADPAAEVQLLGGSGPLSWGQDGPDLVLTLPGDLPESPAHCLKITPAPRG
ncbi:MAG: alpha-L-fucosidase [Anaerolineaceae bacterium]|nr:alpha-L-fucosidase [Anaerolineaceae bacterium]